MACHQSGYMVNNNIGSCTPESVNTACIPLSINDLKATNFNSNNIHNFNKKMCDSTKAVGVGFGVNNMTNFMQNNYRMPNAPCASGMNETMQTNVHGNIKNEYMPFNYMSDRSITSYTKLINDDSDDVFNYGLNASDGGNQINENFNFQPNVGPQNDKNSITNESITSDGNKINQNFSSYQPTMENANETLGVVSESNYQQNTEHANGNIASKSIASNVNDAYGEGGGCNSSNISFTGKEVVSNLEKIDKKLESEKTGNLPDITTCIESVTQNPDVTCSDEQADYSSDIASDDDMSKSSEEVEEDFFANEDNDNMNMSSNRDTFSDKGSENEEYMSDESMTIDSEIAYHKTSKICKDDYVGDLMKVSHTFELDESIHDNLDEEEVSDNDAGNCSGDMYIDETEQQSDIVYDSEEGENGGDESQNCIEMTLPDIDSVFSKHVSESLEGESVDAVKGESSSKITVSECDSTSLNSEYLVEMTEAAEIASGLQNTESPQKVEEQNNQDDGGGKRERWTMKIKVGSTADGSRCEIIKQIDYQDAVKDGLVKDGTEVVNGHDNQNISEKKDVGTPGGYIKSVVGKRRVQRRVWREEEDIFTPEKKTKGGLRYDCPSFCRSGCTKIHHPLLISARRMIENDATTTALFLQDVDRYYGGDLGELKPVTVINDPWKNTNYPLLHYLALMGKCSGCFALIDAGHKPDEVISQTGDTVLHTLVREMYNFNCTHGHMDILLKKFTLLLKELSICLSIENNDKETPFHLLGKLIQGTSQLLNIPGRNKVPYRLYQFGKNMLSACLSQFRMDGRDPELLNRQDLKDNTVSHYVAMDRASDELLGNLKEQGANFLLMNKAQQIVEDVKLMAPPPPDSDVLKLAEISAKSNKFKKSISNRIKVTSVVRKPTSKKKSLKKELSNEQVTDSFMEMLNSKLLAAAEWEPIENMKLKKRNKTAGKATKRNATTPLSSEHGSTPKYGRKKSSSQNSMKKEKQNEERIPMMPGMSTSMANANVSEVPPVKDIFRSTVSTSIADVSISRSSHMTSVVSAPTVSMSNGMCPGSSENMIKIERQENDGYTSSTKSDLSFIDRLCSLTNSVTATPASVLQSAISNAKSNTYAIKAPSVSATLRPPNTMPVGGNQLSFPIISSVKSLDTTLGGADMRNLYMYRPVPPPLTHQRPRGMTPSLPAIVPRPPPPPLQTNNPTCVASQQPLLLKTADGKLMSINVVQVSKSNPSSSSAWPRVTPMPPLLNVHPQPPHSHQTQFIDGNNLRYIAPTMAGQGFRQPQPNSLNASTASYPYISSASTFNGGSHQQTINNNNNNTLDTRFIPSVLPQFQPSTNSIPNVNTFADTTNLNILSQASIFQKLMNAQSLISSTIQNTLTTTKNDAKKSRGLEASIENLRYSAMNVIPTTRSRSTPKSHRLSASVGKTDDSAPPVIILDENEDMASRVRKNDTRELQSPSIESSQDLDAPIFRDMDNVASFMKNYLQEKGSIDDFVKFSNEKKEALVKQLDDEREKMKEISKEIATREVDIKDTREHIVEKEMEIAHLRLKATKVQNDVVQLKNRRQAVTDKCNELEKRMKALGDQTALFQTWNTSTDIRCDK